MTDKQQLAAEIGQLEGQLAQREMELARLRDKARRAQSQYVGGVVGIIVGGALAFLIGGSLNLLGWIGALIAAAGLLATITGTINRIVAGRRVKVQEEALVAQRSRLAELRAQLLV